MFQRLAHSTFLKKNQKHYTYTYFTLHCFRDPKSFSVCNIKYTLVHVNMICCYQNRSREVLHRYTEDVLEAFLIMFFFNIIFLSLCLYWIVKIGKQRERVGKTCSKGLRVGLESRPLISGHAACGCLLAH